MLTDLLPHLPAILLAITVLYLVASQRRERKRRLDISPDLTATIDGLNKQVGDLAAELTALSEYNLSVEDRVLNLEAALAEARERLSKHRSVLEELGGVIEHEFIRIDHQLVDLEARSDAWTMPAEDDAVEAEFEIETDPALPA